MNVLELDSGLFPDRDRVAAALRDLESGHRVERIDIGAAACETADWDRIVAAILAADKVITV